MRSKSRIGHCGGGCRLFKGFKIDQAYARLTSSGDRQLVNKIMNKRARHLDYVDVYGFDMFDPE